MTGFCAICGKPASVPIKPRGRKAPRPKGLCTECAWCATRSLAQEGALAVRLEAGGWPQERELQIGDGAVLVRIASLVPGAEDAEP